MEGFFEAAERDGFEGMTHTQAEWVDGGHGRIETRRCVVAEVPVGQKVFAGWRKLKTLAKVESRREINGEVSLDRRDYIRSRQADASDLGQASRGHWGIENQRHGSLDVSYGEDQARMRAGHAVENFFASHHPPLDSPRQDAQDRH